VLPDRQPRGRPKIEKLTDPIAPLTIIPSVPVVAPGLSKPHPHLIANKTQDDKENTKLDNIDDFETGQKIQPDIVLGTELETKPTIKADLPSPLPTLDQYNHPNPESHILVVPAIMTNPDIANDHHLSRFVFPLPEHNTNNPKLSSVSVEPSEPSTSRGNEDQKPRYQFRKRKRNNQEDEEDERQAKVMKALIAMATQSPDPKHASQWKSTVDEEIKSLVQNGIWEEHILPKDSNLVLTKWIFTIQIQHSKIERFKACLVARGFTQVLGKGYNETFAPTVRLDTLRKFLAIVAKADLECSHFDIKNAFTESHLKEDIYLAPPQGVQVQKGHVLHALRTLYGLKQAGRDWSLLLKGGLLKIGFV
jgi:hypothetical protein